MVEIPEHLRKRAEEALRKAEARKAAGGGGTTRVVLGHVVAQGCPRCVGAGELPNPEWVALDDLAIGSLAMDLAIERLMASGKPDTEQCVECEGRGEILTEHGRALAAFVKEYG